MPAIRAPRADGSFTAPGCLLAGQGAVRFPGRRVPGRIERGGYRPLDFRRDWHRARLQERAGAATLGLAAKDEALAGLTTFDDCRTHVLGIISLPGTSFARHGAAVHRDLGRLDYRLLVRLVLSQDQPGEAA
jgi:hypothetical protein